MRRKIVFGVAGLLAICFLGFVGILLFAPDAEESTPVITDRSQADDDESEIEPTKEPEPVEPDVDSSEPNTPADTPTPEPEPTKVPPTQAPEPPQEANLGDLFELEGYSFAAVTVEDPATPGILYTPEEGTRLVAVEIVVGNVSAERITVNALNTTLLDAEGFTYVAELAGRDDQISLVDLEPGQRAKGWVAFELPEDATPATVKYAVKSFSDLIMESNLTTIDGELVANSDVPLTADGEVSREIDAGLGEMVESEGYSLVVEVIEDPASPGILYTPLEGTRLVAVEIAVGNESGELITVNPLNTILVDTNGYLYEAELAGSDNQLDLVDLNAGERVRGWVAFEIPEDAVPESVRYQVSGFPIIELQARVTE